MPLLGAKPIADVAADGMRALVEALDETVRREALHWNTARKIPLPLRPLLVFLKGKGTPAVRVVRSNSAKRGELAATLREHLLRAGVNRTELHEERRTTKRVTSYDLLDGITCEVLARTEHLKIQQRAGHKSFSTTRGYSRTAEELGASIGDPVPPLPAPLTSEFDSGGESKGESETGFRTKSREILGEGRGVPDGICTGFQIVSRH